MLLMKLKSNTITPDHTARKVGLFLLHRRKLSLRESPKVKAEGTRVRLVQTSKCTDKETEAQCHTGSG